jgi:hypothetical protein
VWPLFPGGHFTLELAREVFREDHVVSRLLRFRVSTGISATMSFPSGARSTFLTLQPHGLTQQLCRGGHSVPVTPAVFHKGSFVQRSLKCKTPDATSRSVTVRKKRAMI